MEDINNYIKENDTDNRIIKNLNDLIDTILYNDDEYDDVVDEYTNGKTIVECLDKLENALFDYTMDKIYSSGGSSGGATITTKYVTTLDNSTESFDIIVTPTNDYDVITVNGGFYTASLTSASLGTNNKVKIADIKVDAGVNEDYRGVLSCSICDPSDNYKFYSGSVYVDGTEMFLILSDNSILTDTAKSLDLDFNGILKRYVRA